MLLPVILISTLVPEFLIENLGNTKMKHKIKLKFVNLVEKIKINLSGGTPDEEFSEKSLQSSGFRIRPKLPL